MTDILFGMLKKEYPPIKDYERVSIYGPHERIYLDLVEKKLINTTAFNSSGKIKQIAETIFDVPFEFESRGDIREAIFFEPTTNNKYQLNHSNHYIKVHLPLPHPQITISTGNRGAVQLFETQRNNYFDFVKEIHKSFLNNIK